MWFLSLLMLAAMIFAIVDIVLRDDGEVKHLPRIVWLFLVVLLPLLGTILWFTLGREYPEQVGRPRRGGRERAWNSAPPPASGPAGDTRSTEQQLADLEREIEAGPPARGDRPQARPGRPSRRSGRADRVSSRRPPRAALRQGRCSSRKPRDRRW